MLDKNIDIWLKEHEDEIVENIGRLVKFNSVSKETDGVKVFGEECANVLETALKIGDEFGFKTHNADYYAGIISYGESEKSIGIWGHSDIVPAGDNWIHKPFECTREGDFIFGRGVKDNKGAIILGLYAMRYIKEMGIPVKNKIAQYIGCNEEAGMKDIEYLMKNYKMPDISLVADCDFPVCYGEKGILEANLSSATIDGNLIDLCAGEVSNLVPDNASMFISKDDSTIEKLKLLSKDIAVQELDDCIKLSSVGKSAHVSTLYEGVNAIAVLLKEVLSADLLNGNAKAIAEFIYGVTGTCYGEFLGIDFEDTQSGKLTCGACIVRVKDKKAILNINVRYPVTTDETKMLEQLQEVCAKNNFEILNKELNKPNYIDQNSELVQKLTKVYNDMTMESAKPFTMGGGTYARKLPNAVGFGPEMPVDLTALNLPQGHGDAHCPDEVLSVSNLLLSIKIYIRALIELDKTL